MNNFPIKSFLIAAVFIAVISCKKNDSTPEPGSGPGPDPVPIPDSSYLNDTSGYATPLSYTGYNLVWNDEFSGSSIDAASWSFEIGNNGGWGNNELETYTMNNAFAAKGKLVIEARRESVGGYNYTSARMVTKYKKSFTYGRVDIRAKLPYGQGIWPALWMLGENIDAVSWPACGEMDIMEMVGN
jgi:beta-glucanase (GH16 family)